MSDTISSIPTGVDSSNPPDFPAFTARTLAQLRRQTPLVQAITNSVVTNFTANALLALGTAPAMVDIPAEAGVFARLASGLLINLGTPTPSQVEAALEAAAAAHETGTPWVLDPVAVGVLPVRTALARQLLAFEPAVVRGNASEIIAVAGGGGGGRGVDATDSVAQAEQTAIALALRTGGVVAVSGPVDFITDGHTQVRVANGTPLLTQVTGGGCALGGVMAACAALAATPAERLATTVAAVAIYTIAAERAAAQARGPGSFAVRFIDELASLSAHEVLTQARIEVAAT
ncbi:hydroxyethylthiazole kinase [Corticibacter populi]|uniref:Hydroxyethylthiazole kinase n=1 Tax=Corticibacter populi TaxID=1550736 RepID=A0A3M6R0D3_9BURK|nr:hydroxyethylthiazole kinase [Corticibacter populi]RMX08717.1 hydroxyethylthiazole kinase [Corticibacter populi]RZS36066.1 hydroxyethylthiazole kinase [Corticibacter populi]